MDAPRIAKILIAHDGSDGAAKALTASIALAKRFGAELHSISVEEELPHYAIARIGKARRTCFSLVQMDLKLQELRDRLDAEARVRLREPVPDGLHRGREAAGPDHRGS